MNIKGLLLGSAAALVAVSGARAADAVVIAEPEPMEYVRVCDTYGVGYYYIPGTETCLKVSGYMRYDIGVGAVGIVNSLDKSDYVEDGVFNDNDTYYKRARFALRVDSRTETELGTLRTYAQVNFQYDVNSAGVGPGGAFAYTYTEDEVAIEHAYIELGGFRIGKTDSLFSTFTGYSSGVSNDGLVPYGPFGTHQIAYTFTGGNGFTAAVALEEGGDGEGNYDLGSYALDDYVPNVVGGVGWTGGWGGISVVGGYDAVYEEGAVKGRVDFNVNDAISLFVMGAWSSNDDSDWDIDGINSQNYYAPWGGEWAIWGGGAWKVTEQATINLEIGYDDFENFSTVANVDYELVPNFHVIPEIVYVDNFNDDFPEVDDNWGGFLRLQANFGG
jgi:hypothetical protein